MTAGGSQPSAQAAGPCFPEPLGDDPPARWATTIVAYLERSPLRRAGAGRAFLNRHLDAIPSDAAVDLCRRMHDPDQFDQVLFELLAGRFLALLGAQLEYEPKGANVRAVDWRATFADGSAMFLEATSPVFDGWANVFARGQAPLLDILERETPTGWSVAVVALPRIGPNDRLGPFRAELHQMFAGVPEPQAGGDRLTRFGQVDQGRIELVLLPVRYDSGAVVMSGGGGGFDDTPARVAAVLRDPRKVGQARAFPGQVVLALGAGRFPHRRDVLDRVLLGVELAGRWEANGVLARQGRADFQAVLVFPGLGLGGGDDPVVYHHPMATADLPDALAVLEHRRLGTDGVTVTPASRTRIVAELGFPGGDD